MRRALALAVLLLPAAARAESGIGLAFAEIGAAAIQTEEDWRASGHLTGDVRVTGAHGLQLDLRLADDDAGVVGQIDAHLYMSPHKSRKYGLFLSLADVDGREATVAQAGLEAMVELAPGTVVAGRAALGYARPRDIDFIAVSARLDHALSDDLSVFAEIGLAEFDEEILRTVTRQSRAGLIWEPAGRPFAATLALARDGITGRDARPAETRAEFGLTFRFGAKGGALRPVLERAFTARQPMAPLIAAGLF
jgi:hypothetical protein